MKTPDLATQRGLARLQLAGQAMQGLICNRMSAVALTPVEIEVLCDKAIEYADTMMCRLAETPIDKPSKQ